MSPPILTHDVRHGVTWSPSSSRFLNMGRDEESGLNTLQLQTHAILLHTGDFEVVTADPKHSSHKIMVDGR